MTSHPFPICLTMTHCRLGGLGAGVQRLGDVNGTALGGQWVCPSALTPDTHTGAHRAQDSGAGLVIPH